MSCGFDVCAVPTVGACRRMGRTGRVRGVVGDVGEGQEVTGGVVCGKAPVVGTGELSVSGGDGPAVPLWGKAGTSGGPLHCSSAGPCMDGWRSSPRPGRSQGGQFSRNEVISVRLLPWTCEGRRNDCDFGPILRRGPVGGGGRSRNENELFAVRFLAVDLWGEEGRL